MALDVLRHAGIFATVSMLIALIPMVMGILYAIRPDERRLALMRPLSLAGLCAGLGAVASGSIMTLTHVGEADFTTARVAIAMAESITPLFIAFGSLTIAWLCVALGLTRQAP